MLEEKLLVQKNRIDVVKAVRNSAAKKLAAWGLMGIVSSSVVANANPPKKDLPVLPSTTQGEETLQERLSRLEEQRNEKSKQLDETGKQFKEALEKMGANYKQIEEIHKQDDEELKDLRKSLWEHEKCKMGIQRLEMEIRDLKGEGLQGESDRRFYLRKYEERIQQRYKQEQDLEREIKQHELEIKRLKARENKDPSREIDRRNKIRQCEWKIEIAAKIKRDHEIDRGVLEFFCEKFKDELMGLEELNNEIELIKGEIEQKTEKNKQDKKELKKLQEARQQLIKGWETKTREEEKKDRQLSNEILLIEEKIGECCSNNQT